MTTIEQDLQYILRAAGDIRGVASLSIDSFPTHPDDPNRLTWVVRVSIPGVASGGAVEHSGLDLAATIRVASELVAKLDRDKHTASTDLAAAIKTRLDARPR